MGSLPVRARPFQCAPPGIGPSANGLHSPFRCKPDPSRKRQRPEPRYITPPHPATRPAHLEDQMKKVDQYLSQNADRFVEELKSFLRIPSVSAISAHQKDVRQAAEWVRDQLRAAG